MKPGENYNHPKKGALINVEPIRDIDSINRIKKLLSDKPRDLCLFTIGINTNLRASDLLTRIFHEILPKAGSRGVFVSYSSTIIFYLVIVQRTALQGGILLDFIEDLRWNA